MTEKCERCNGKGKILFGIDGYSHIYDCPHCNGTEKQEHPSTKGGAR
jgi:DnaJ-class molecular chaperone